MIIQFYNRKLYAVEQYQLGNSCYQEGDVQKACEYWKNVRMQDNAGVYAWAQYKLGDCFDLEGDIEQARDYWGNISPEDDLRLYAIV